MFKFGNILGNGDDCRTPKNEIGVCRLFRECEPLNHISANSSREDINLLRQSLCSRKDGKNYVCCPHVIPVFGKIFDLSNMLQNFSVFFSLSI